MAQDAVVIGGLTGVANVHAAGDLAERHGRWPGHRWRGRDARVGRAIRFLIWEEEIWAAAGGWALTLGGWRVWIVGQNNLTLIHSHEGLTLGYEPRFLILAPRLALLYYRGNTHASFYEAELEAVGLVHLLDNAGAPLKKLDQVRALLDLVSQLFLRELGVHFGREDPGFDGVDIGTQRLLALADVEELVQEVLACGTRVLKLQSKSLFVVAGAGETAAKLHDLILERVGQGEEGDKPRGHPRIGTSRWRS